MVSGAAALSPQVAYFFSGLGVAVLQGYGLSETSPGVTINPPSANKIGTVGPPIPGVEVKIAEDGEILVHGPNVMPGYYNLPEENARAFTEDGWFRTGDIGRFDEDGYLVITDRKKDLMKTSGGKYIAPQAIETLIRLSPLVSQVVVVGNGRKFPAALVVPNFEALKDFAQASAIIYSHERELIEHPHIISHYQKQVDELTVDLSQYEKIKKVALLPTDFTIEGGELTPTMKVRRRVIETQYQDVIDKLYEE